ncbi:MAG TPA: NUDIX domain-containing protein [Candidatus Saccharimonadales bacterium]|nr:NUDIX domain-containing protein [Candidatus Saccharimonadales bacterium]
MRRTIKGEKQFTASVWLITRTKPKKVLLIHHKKFGKWVQPGGHIEQFENPIECAIREIKEETGLDISFITDSIKTTSERDSFLPIPEFLMEYPIAEHEDEPAHFHIDINYVVKVKEQMLKVSKREAHDIGWFRKSEALKLPIHENTKIILQKLLY